MKEKDMSRNLVRAALVAAGVSAVAFVAAPAQATPAQGNMIGDTAAVPVTPVDFSVTIGDHDRGWHRGEDWRWRRWHGMHGDRWDHRPSYGRFHGDNCRVEVVTRWRDGMRTTVRRQICS